MPQPSPIENRIGQVFIPVRDIAHSARWYSALLGLPEGEATHDATIYDLPTTGETRLALDANRSDVDTSGPSRFFFWTADMVATVDFLQHLEVTMDTGVVDIGGVLFVQFRDPDGNPLMVCQRTGA